MEGICVNFLDQVQFFSLFLKGRCHGNQFSGKMGQNYLYPLHLSLCQFKTPEKTGLSEFAVPIFTIFSPNESILGADGRSGPLFPISQGTLPLPWQQFCVKNGKLCTFVALQKRNEIMPCICKI